MHGPASEHPLVRSLSWEAGWIWTAFGRLQSLLRCPRSRSHHVEQAITPSPVLVSRHGDLSWTKVHGGFVQYMVWPERYARARRKCY